MLERDKNCGEEVLSLPKKIPGLDGLRCVAIIAVILYHLDKPMFGQGWAGVQLFFVLSGFLITGILLDSRKSDNYFKNFYARRAIRIFPIYYIAVALMIVYSVLLGLSYQDWTYYITYTQNYLMAAKGGHASFPGMFSHSWSLAVEEQFYLCWPLIIFFLRRKTLLIATWVLFFAAPLFRFLMVVLNVNHKWLANPLAAQLDTLCMGALLAIFVRSNIKRKTLRTAGMLMSIVGGIGWIGILYCKELCINNIGNLAHAIQNTILAVCFGGIVILASMGTKYLAVLLDNVVAKHIGKISYGIYLYHKPILEITRAVCNLIGVGHAQNVLCVTTITVVFTYLVSITSWYLVEKPLLGLKERFSG